MGVSLYVPDPGAAIPRPVWLDLSCDGEHRDLFSAAAAATFRQASYIEQRHEAARVGWRFAADGMVLGPCCSGKRIVTQTD